MNRLKLSKEEAFRLAMLEADCASIAAGRRTLKVKPQPAATQKAAQLQMATKTASRS